MEVKSKFRSDANCSRWIDGGAGKENLVFIDALDGRYSYSTGISFFYFWMATTTKQLRDLIDCVENGKFLVVLYRKLTGNRSSSLRQKAGMLGWE